MRLLSYESLVGNVAPVFPPRHRDVAPLGLGFPPEAAQTAPLF